MGNTFSEIRDDMQIDWNVPLEMDDGVVLSADIYRPVREGKYPVLVSYGPYGKGLPFQAGYPDAWNLMVDKYPETAGGSTNKYQNWEVVDPEKWVPDGYAVMRVDARGAGCSAGYLDPWSLREAQDCYLCIEWAAAQSWSNGKVGTNGISYYAAMGWLTAGLQPPHLAAMCIWEGSFVRSASKDKWLEVHGGKHWTGFYTDYGIGLQKRFFGYYLQGEDTGWDEQPPVRLPVRHLDKFGARYENEWPIARTRWTKLYLDPIEHKLANAPPRQGAILEFDACGPGLTFISPCFEQETEITGPLAAKLFVSSSTGDADLFLVFRLFTPDMLEVTFVGAIDPRTPITQGWLRASHRKLDLTMSTAYRPYHSHDEIQPLQPDVPVELDIEIWPTCIVVPAGYRVALTVRGKDFEIAKSTGYKLSHFKNEMLGCGPFLHNDPRQRLPEVFGGRTTLHFDEGHASYVLIPVIPPK